jgi:hypothetical protein
MAGGDPKQVEIPRAISESDVFLACLSKAAALKQGYIQKEFRLALVAYSERPPGKVFLIPVKLDDCEIPRIQMPELGIDLADFQWVELWRHDGFARLVKAIGTVVDVFHPPGTEKHRQQPLTPCRFEISPKYAKMRRWTTLADVLVDLHEPGIRGAAYLIPSGVAPQSMRHTELLRNAGELLERKRAATLRFILQSRDCEIEGKWFRMRKRSGEEVIAVYSLSYDLCLDEFARNNASSDNPATSSL